MNPSPSAISSSRTSSTRRRSALGLAWGRVERCGANLGRCSKTLLIGVVLTVSSLSLGTSQAEDGKPTPRGIVVSWDGAPDWVLDRFLAEGHLPSLTAMIQTGVRTEHSVPPMPSKTAVGHATLWTGTGPAVHGVVGNSVPRAEDGSTSILERRRGFDSDVLTAEPLYRTAALAGRRVVVLSATHSYPSEAHQEILRSAGVSSDRLTVFSGFEHTLAEGRLIDATDVQPADAAWTATPAHVGARHELLLQVAESRFYALLYDSPDDPINGLDRVLIRAESRVAGGAEAVLVPQAADRATPRGWSPPFTVRRLTQEGQTHFRLFDLAPDGSHLALYQWKASALEGAFTPEQLRGYSSAYTAFHDDAFYRYASDHLGTPLMEGGDGRAENRLLEIVARDTDLLIAGTRWAAEHLDPDLLFHYSPMSDSAGHTWMGVLDPASPAHDAKLAEALWPIYRGVFEHLDRWLGVLLDLAGDDAVLALVTDHGMAGTGGTVYLNRILENAGLLTRSASGGIDVGKTAILAADGDFYLRVVDERWKEGRPITDTRREEILQRASEALLAARDPDSGKPLIRRVIRPESEPEAEIDCPRCGDLYVDPAPGYYPSTRMRRRIAEPDRRSWGAGSHGYWPARREMHGIAYFTGPGLRRGVTVPAIRQRDIAPTLAHLLGLPAPAQATGQLVDAALLEGALRATPEGEPMVD